MIVVCARAYPARKSSPTTINLTHAMASAVKAEVFFIDRMNPALLQSGEEDEMRHQRNRRRSVIDRFPRYLRRSRLGYLIS